MVDRYKNVLCLGAGFIVSSTGIDRSYKVKDGPFLPLGVGLEQGDSTMSTHIISGMPYGSLECNNMETVTTTIYSYNGLSIFQRNFFFLASRFEKNKYSYIISHML